MGKQIRVLSFFLIFAAGGGALVGCTASTVVDSLEQAISIPGGTEEGGIDFSPGGTPTVALVDVNGNLFCSGTLVTSRHVVTAAHCVRGQTTFRVQVNPLENGPERLASACAVHPDVAATCETVQMGVPSPDIAVLTLAEPFPADVPTLNLRPPTQCFRDSSVPIMIRGFGRNEEGVATYPARRYFLTNATMDTNELRYDNSSLPAVGIVGQGDSGGTIVEFGQSSLLAVVTSGTDSGLSGSGMPLWGYETANPDPIYWVWSIISTGCELGSTTPCIVEGETRPRLDSDGDGLPDEIDLCPTLNPFVLGLPLNAEGTNHRDEDGDWVGDDCDACPGVCDHDPAAAASGDTDGDGVYNLCDSCPNDPPLPGCGRFHCDSDVGVMGVAAPDGIGDACDLCPTVHVPPGLTNHEDNDGDSIGNECDNCVDDPNYAQLNCNIDSERDLRIYDPAIRDVFDTAKFGVGDACDDFECPDTRFSSVSGSVGDIHTRSLSRVSVDARRNVAGTEPVRTGFRWCRCEVGRAEGPIVPSFDVDDSLNSRERCASEGCAINDILAYDELVDDPAQENDANWRLATLIHRAGTDVVGEDAQRAEARLDYGPVIEPFFMPTLNSGWTRMTDQNRWVAVREPELQDNPTFGLFPGVFWSHAAGTGVDDTGNFERFRRLRTSHYWSGVNPTPRVVDRRLRDDILRRIGPHLPIGIVDDVETLSAAFPIPWMYVDNTDGAPHLGFGDGAAIDASSLFPQGFSSLFDIGADLGQWVGAAESAPLLPAGGSRYVALSNDATQVVACLFDSPVGLVPPGFSPNNPPPNNPPPTTDNPPIGDPVNPPGGPVNPPTTDNIPLANSFSEFSGGATPPARDDALVALSSRRGQLWMTGGTLHEDGRGAHDLWRYDLTRGQWDKLTLPRRARLNNPQAITYDPVAHVLWVLDGPRIRDTHHGRRHRRHRRHRHITRLLRIDPNGESFRVEGRWPTILAPTLHALSSDPSGGLWLIASRGYASHAGHVIVHFEANRRGRLVPRSFGVGHGALASGQAWSNREGVSFAIAEGDIAIPTGARPNDLYPLRRRHLRQCF